MTRVPLVAAAFVAAAAFSLLSAAPSVAQPLVEAPAGASAPAAPTRLVSFATPPADPAKGNVNVGVMYKSTWLSPLSQVEISLWKLDEGTGYYVQLPSVGWSGDFDDWTSQDLEPGTYSIRFLASDVSIGLEWYNDARYFFESEDLIVTAGQTVDLGTVILDERYFDVGRVFGGSRFETAAEISRWAVPPGSSPDVVYVTNGMTYPDALAAGPAAILQGGVLLLTYATSLPQATSDRLAELDPARVVVVGGPGAVSDGVLNAIKAVLPGTAVDRVGGTSRYDTGENIVRDAYDAGADVAIIATGRNYPDALAAGPAAGVMGAPVILVDGTASTPAAETLTLLDDLGVQQVIIAGGTGAVSAGIESGLAAHGIGEVVRIAGTSRYATAAQLNAAVFGVAEDSFLANGMNFPDALAGAPLAGAWGAPLFLTPPTCVGVDAADGIISHRANGVWLLGGTGALSADVEDLLLCP
jgi:putative cell wall-binding protein